MSNVTIPVTRNLSTDVLNLVGTLEIPADFADYMAECYTHDLDFRMAACVAIQDGKPVLKHVSLFAIPVKREAKTQ